MSYDNAINRQVDNPFEHPKVYRQKIIETIKLTPSIQFNGKGFICTLITSRCPVGCEHCMFSSSMLEAKNPVNTLTPENLSHLMKLIHDSNTGYFLVSGGGEGFLELDLMYRIAEETKADITWMVTCANWAIDENKAIEIIHHLHDAFIKGEQKKPGRKICLRVSIDSQHIEKIARKDMNPLQHIINVIKIFEREYPKEGNFCLMLHSLQGEEELIDELCHEIAGEGSSYHDLLHDRIKVTECALTVKLESGYSFEVTYAKRLLSDLSADLRNEDLVKRRVSVFDKDAYQNERGIPAVKYNGINGEIGPNMLVLYNGRVAGGWQSEMPDVSINLESDNFKDIMKKTLTDPGVLATIEKGLAYRFGVIQEVCPKAVLRAKAVNIRDYTSLVLLEEDKVKLYYSIRVIQDYISEKRIPQAEINSWPQEIRFLISIPKKELQVLYSESKYDIIQQFIEKEADFYRFIQRHKQYTKQKNLQLLLDFFEENPQINKKIIDKWRLLFKRIANDWYEIYSFNTEEISAVEEVERILDQRLLLEKRYYEGLSIP